MHMSSAQQEAEHTLVQLSGIAIWARPPRDRKAAPRLQEENVYALLWSRWGWKGGGGGGSSWEGATRPGNGHI